MPTFENEKSVWAWSAHHEREVLLAGVQLWVSRCSLVQSEPILGTISPKIQPKFMGNFCVIPIGITKQKSDWSEFHILIYLSI